MKTPVKERPILFNGPMVRALLDGSKTQTRRVVKLLPWMLRLKMTLSEAWADHGFGDGWYLHIKGQAETWHRLHSPYGQVGDRLWVRETWRGIVQINGPHESYKTGVARYVPEQKYCKKVEFAATDKSDYVEQWRPSIHMPRWASRITLEITSVRVERLQDISEADAKAEGLFRFEYGGQVSWRDYSLSDEWAEVSPMLENPIDSYRTLWESINSPGSWDANPWVWVVEFKREEVPTC